MSAPKRAPETEHSRDHRPLASLRSNIHPPFGGLSLPQLSTYWATPSTTLKEPKGWSQSLPLASFHHLLTRARAPATRTTSLPMMPPFAAKEYHSEFPGAIRTFPPGAVPRCCRELCLFSGKALLVCLLHLEQKKNPPASLSAGGLSRVFRTINAFIYDGKRLNKI